MRVLIAPDSFKGSADGRLVADHVAAGWLAVRPGDDVRRVPLADGGEGTLDVVASAAPGSRPFEEDVTGPDGRVHRAPWLLLPDGTAVVELAAGSGLPLLAAPAPLTSHTVGFGELLRHAARHRSVRRVVAAVGGSASTDGGTGALRALGARFLDSAGHDLPLGGAALRDVAHVDTRHLLPPPPDGVELLCDVTASLLGPRGAAAQFGPQKGADASGVAVLEDALSRLGAVLGAPTDAAGTGAAGGTAYGLAALWGARLVPGAAAVGALVGLDEHLAWADLVITGEGQLDPQSLGGKVVGHLLKVAGDTPVWACVGHSALHEPAGLAGVLSLTELAGSAAAALSATTHWLEQAGAALAGRHSSPPGTSHHPTPLTRAAVPGGTSS